MILGWSQQIFTILSELVLANENQRRSRDRHPGRPRQGARWRTRSAPACRRPAGRAIVCRSGSPIDLDDLEIARLQTSRSIIILAPETDDPDADVIKTMLAITNNPRRRPEPYHIVAEIRDRRNMEVGPAGRRRRGRSSILVGDLIARIVAQTCRQSGLSVVYTELLDFDGDEIYFADEPELVGRTFGEALLAFEDSALIGLRPRDGRPR